MEYKTLTQEVVKFITTRSDEELADLTVAKLAHIFGVDRCKLTRKFKIYKAMTPEFYIFREKMIRAAFLLSFDDDIPIQKVAESMGFCNCQYFKRVFEKFFGVAPCKYREYRQKRSGIKDRRKEPRDRRKNNGKRVSGLVERRKNPGDRRKGVKNRRKDSPEMEGHISIQDLLKMMRDHQ